MKKLLSLILAAMLISLSACVTVPSGDTVVVPFEEAEHVTIPEFSVLVNGVEITNETMADYTAYYATVTTVNSHGTETTYTYLGYLLSDVLKAAGVTEYATLDATADDGYCIRYKEYIAGSPATMLAVMRDNDTGVWVAPCMSTTSGDYLKNVVSITTNSN